ncbi:MAG: restriction endonuclease subunit R [Enterocloster citroniae]|nr:restriction endonuclease subunit R [Enterocloster citroniae]
MNGILKIQASNLVLNINNTYDPQKLDLEKWDEYLDLLCGERTYQKEAIKAAIIYLASGEYSSINQLAKENYRNNIDLQDKYKSEKELLKSLQLPDKLSGVIDLATGTGKSYVMYGIAQMMLALNVVKRVLILCPSVTIEQELKKKFDELVKDSRLRSSIPTELIGCKAPRIIDANSTIKPGDICIENIHAVYDNTGSSIQNSFASGGEDTLVLNDEVHHAYNASSDKDIKKWKQFLCGDKNFRYILGFTGTAYINNEYFSDVIYRFSLRNAMDAGFVKLVEYVSRDESINQNEKFQKIYDNHKEFQRKYRKIKPLTIVVSKDIKSSENLSEDFIDFLCSVEGIEKDDACKKVLVVTSAVRHKKNIIALRTIDDSDNYAEWIFSVSMLTEGWDVKNVFQIVPWEDRAFNSKLLIAQVLGRGLRIPNGIGAQPKVRVFNHASWSKNIQLLVDEILETELTLTSHILTQGERSKYNFNLYTLDYSKEERTVAKHNKTQEVFDLTKGIKLISDLEEEKKETEYEDIKGNLQIKVTNIQKETISVNEVVNKIVESFKGRALEAKLVFPSGEYEQEKLPSINDIQEFIRKSMQDCGIQGEYLTQENANKIYGKFTGLLRKKPSTPIFTKKVDNIIEIETKSMRNETARFSVLKKYMTLFLANTYRNEMDKEEAEMYENAKEEMIGRQIREVSKYNIKTPVNMVFTTLEPEKRFVQLLTDNDLSKHIDAWIKARDVGFYSIDYQKNKGSKFQSFNPDFFIKVKDNIIVVETKADNDISDENRAKYKAAKRHFELLNLELSKKNIDQKYYFCFLSPADYKTFEQYVIDGRMFTSNFRSKLEDALEKMED